MKKWAVLNRQEELETRIGNERKQRINVRREWSKYNIKRRKRKTERREINKWIDNMRERTQIIDYKSERKKPTNHNRERKKISYN